MGEVRLRKKTPVFFVFHISGREHELISSSTTQYIFNIRHITNINRLSKGSQILFFHFVSSAKPLFCVLFMTDVKTASKITQLTTEENSFTAHRLFINSKNTNK